MSTFALWGQQLLAGTLWLATPIILAALGALICERGGLSPLIVAACMVASAAVTAGVAQATGSTWFGFLVGAGGGVAIGALYAVAAVYLHLNHHLSAVALIAIALGLTRESPAITVILTRAPLIYLGIAAGIGAGWYLQYSKPGLRLRAAGEYPAALHAAGVNVQRARAIALIIGGLLGGLAGAMIVAGGPPAPALTLAAAVPSATVLIAGRAFIAVALTVAGARRPLGIITAALALALIEAFSILLRPTAPAWLPAELHAAVPYLSAIILVAALGALSRAPQEAADH